MAETENTEITEEKTTDAPVEKKEKSLKGLGGWLILVAFGLVVNIALMSSTLVELVGLLQSDDIYVLGAHFEYLLMFEVAMIGSFIAFIAYTLFLFARSKKEFPMFFIAFVILGFLLLIVDAAAVNFVIPEVPFLSPETTTGLIQQVFYACIWIPYMRISKRVKQTFVN